MSLSWRLVENFEKLDFREGLCYLKYFFYKIFCVYGENVFIETTGRVNLAVVRNRNT
jgi:hypothetical protein